jgi:hypothetical protein
MMGEGTSMRFVDGIVADFLESSAAAEAAARLAAEPEMITQATDQLAPADRAILREKVRDEIAQARADERQQPGAFVEVRRPH